MEPYTQCPGQLITWDDLITCSPPVEAMLYEGEHWALPIDVEAIALVYNEDLVATPPSTFEGLGSSCAGMTSIENCVGLHMPDAYRHYPFLTAFGGYAFENLAFFAGQSFTLTHQLGLLAIVLAGAALWVFSATGERRTTLQLHSTQLLSGVLFVFMAVLMLNGTLAEFNAFIPTDLAPSH